MMLKILCVVVEWSFLRSLWIPFVAATSSSKSFAKHSTHPASIQHDENKDDDDDEFSWSPAIIGASARSSKRSTSTTIKSHDSATQMATRSTRTEMSTTANIRSPEPQLPHYSWDNPVENIEPNLVNGITIGGPSMIDVTSGACTISMTSSGTMVIPLTRFGSIFSTGLSHE